MWQTVKNGDVSSWQWERLNCLIAPFFAVKHWQWIAFFVLTALVLRLFLVLTHAPYLGIDGGAYVLSALDVQGKDITSVGFPRPPLAPGWLLVPFIELLGIDTGYKVWTVLFSFLPFIPVYLLTRYLAGKSIAVFAIAFFSVDMMQMEMMVTGSLPLIGFSLIGMAIWALLHISAKGDWRHMTVLALSIGLLPYINQTAAGIAAIILPLIVVGMVLFSEPSQRTERFRKLGYDGGRAALFGILIAMGAAPWYLINAPGNPELRFPGPLFIFVQWHDPALLLQFPLVVALVFLLWRTTKDYRMRAIALTVAVLGVMILFLSHDEAVVNLLFRPRYFLSILVYPAIAYLLRNNWPLELNFRKEAEAIIPMAAVWLVLLWTQTFIFEHQTFFKDMIYPETEQALQIAQRESPDKAIITNAYSMSHWVAALNQVESPNTWGLEPSPFYKESDKNVRCLLGWIDGCNPEVAADELNAGYILIDERMPDAIKSAPIYGRPSDDEWANLPSVPWLKLRKAEGVIKLWEINF